MSSKISKMLLPTIVGASVYIIVERFFPGNLENIGDRTLKNLPLDEKNKFKLVSRLTKRLLTKKALKIALISAFTTAGIEHYKAEIEELLMYSVFTSFCDKPAREDTVKVVCDILKDHDLLAQSSSMKAYIIANDLTYEQKISLLKIKLDFLINGNYPGRKLFLIKITIALLFIFTISGTVGIAMTLEALYRLWKEGKISTAVYYDLVERMTGY